MIYEERFEQFTVYKSDVSNSFLYVNFSDPDRFMDGLSDYVLSEANLINYANTLSPIAFTPTLALIDEYKQKIIRQYKNKFSDYNIYLSIDPEKQYDLTQKNIFIVTHDRVIDENTVAIFESIDFLVIDEVYKFQKDMNNERVLILNIAYYNMVKRSKKYVLLAPFISGVENLDRLSDIPEFYATNYSPVVNEVKTHEILSESERVLYTDKILGNIPVQDNTLIYFPTVVQIDKFVENTTIHTDAFEIDANPVLNEFVAWGKKEIHPQWSVISG